MKRYFLIFYTTSPDPGVGRVHTGYFTEETVGSFPNCNEVIKKNKRYHLTWVDIFITNVVELSQSDYEDWIGQEHEVIEKDVD